ncbi:MAG TPA: flagellin [Phycisphaerae bacterium]|nr:flagellin [Phycisphaerae bacterium]
MAGTFGSISRVSQGMQTLNLLRQLRQNTLRLFNEQQRIASGQQLLSVGDDPLAAAQIAKLRQVLGNQDQILSNLRFADGQLAAADTAITDISDLLTQASRIASEQAGSLSSTTERAAQALVIDGIIDQLEALGNRQYQGSYLFAGRDVTNAPFATSLGRVTLNGDAGDRQTLVDIDSTLAFNVIAADLFNLRETVIGGTIDFDVQLSLDARISELAGALGQGVRLGAISVTETGPNINFSVDFTGAETVNDLVARFNDAATTAGSSLTLGISPTDGGALSVATIPGSGVQIGEVGTGTTASDLGIKQTTGAGINLDGANVNRRVSLTTTLAELAPGGITLPNGVSISNGPLTATVDFAGATTVQDILNRLNGTGVGIRASINDAGTGIIVENLLAGTPLIIGENGGTDAATLGIKSLNTSVPLSQVNGLRGIHPVTGDDFQITNANGVTFQVDLSTAQTFGDAINAINAASTTAGAGIVASISDAGAGLQLTGPAGPGVITVTALNLSPVAQELGILGTGTATELEGTNVAPFYQSGVFSALYRLRDGLLGDNSSEITEAGAQISATREQVSRVIGQVGARSQAMQARLAQTEDATSATTILLSQVRDVDFTEAVTKFQQAQTALQASLLSGSRLQNLSLLDFLR